MVLFYSFGTYGLSYPHMLSCNQPILKPTYNSNGYPYNIPYVPAIQPMYQQIVPTGKLIEVESHNGSTFDLVDGKSSHKSKNFESPNEYYKPIPNHDTSKVLVDAPSSDKKDSQLGDWDYVYRNLESQGYSKDLGERGDLLSPNSIKHMKEARKVKSTNLDDHFNNLIISDKPTKSNEAFNRNRSIDRKKNDEAALIDNSSASSYDNVAENSKKLNKPGYSNSIKQKTSQLEKQTNVIERPPSNMMEEKLSKKKTNISFPIEGGKWQCKACTFINNIGKDICEMCCKSRVTSSEPPMEIGGAECRKCTLVNPKNLKTCEACGSSLENSPTYI